MGVKRTAPIVTFTFCFNDPPQNGATLHRCERGAPAPVVNRSTFSAALDNLDVLIERQVGELIDAPARPFDLDAVNFRRLADPQYLTRVMRGEKAAAAGLESAALYAAGLPGDDGADRAGIAPRCHHLEAEPVV